MDRLTCLISLKALSLFNHYGSIAISTQVFSLTYTGEIIHMLRSYGSPETLYNMALIKLSGTNVLRKFP